MDYYQNDSYKQNQRAGQGFVFASLICGILSIPLGILVIGLPLGALGILFALLTYRRGQRMDLVSKMGMITSILGVISGISLLAFAFLSMPTMLKDEAYRAQMERMYNILYSEDADMTFDDYWNSLEDFYGISEEE